MNKKKMLYIALFAILVYVFYQVGSHDNQKVEVMSEASAVHVYLLYEDELVEVDYDSYFTQVSEQVEEMIEYMKEEHAPFKALLKQDTKLASATLEEGVCVLNFDVLNYDVEDELRVLEAFIYTFTQFSDVHSVDILIQGKSIVEMPLNKTKIVYKDRRFGVNHLHTNSQYLHDHDSILLHQTTNIHGEEYNYIRSVNVKDASDYNAFLTLLCGYDKSDSIATYYFSENKIQPIKDATLKDGVLHLYFNKAILQDKTTIDEQALALLKLNFMQFEEIDALKIYVEDTLIEVDEKKEINIR